ncbi:MAG TPA: F0F1 ATP synthase subunit A [Polyangiaceae bacterium LLY-WYZ-15_(1-7)]|nr:ATP synthase F0 subunit A [Myxococcales bacterium]MAT25202.1 ATP synthase F0 subunit A [Sandaracinus sp.]HJK90802.1 F0F1 ATP synthase subunit A [Polyangiaceae bacterium LLY-WYZ-15_(1-7)]MBJ75124.1 ATP synthase F0 subunit A [Sandaracinus sp.]HJL03577.1 F0F1 ATP synthase subunit A [Polyangiaceae bacterium LLY-WYZ-15_(1-7)]
MADTHAEALPEHWSWFSLLPESLHEGLRQAVVGINAPIAESLGGSPDEKWFFGGRFDVLHIWGFIFVLLLLLWVGFRAKARFGDTKQAIVPEDRLTLPTFTELFTGGVLNLMSSVMGKEAAKYFLPLIGTCAFVIFFSNALGLFPGFLPPTDNLNTTAAMAIIIFVATHVYGIKKQGVGNYLKHFMGPIIFLAPLIFIIEVISHIVRPVTLSIRLTANMFADHAVLGAFLGLSASAFFLPFPVAVYFLGIIVVSVQTLVFCLLSMVYIGAAIEEHEHH